MSRKEDQYTNLVGFWPGTPCEVSWKGVLEFLSGPALLGGAWRGPCREAPARPCKVLETGSGTLGGPWEVPGTGLAGCHGPKICQHQKVSGGGGGPETLRRTIWRMVRLGSRFGVPYSKGD